MNWATVDKIECDGKVLDSITICETGQFAICADILSRKKIFSSALDVLSISVAQVHNVLLLEAKDNITTSEMLAEDVRLQIEPKIDFDAFQYLTQWATYAERISSSETVPWSFRRGTGLCNLLANIFLSHLSRIERYGFIPCLEPNHTVKDYILGEVDVVATSERIFLQGDVRFDQTENKMDYNSIANKIIRTALDIINSATSSLDRNVMEISRYYSAAVPCRLGLQSADDALVKCINIIDRRSLDPSRAYYYPALEASIPILQAAAKSLSGNYHIKDYPMRISTSKMFEDALRNALSFSLKNTHYVGKDKRYKLYYRTFPEVFNKQLEPDIVIRNLGDARKCCMIFDAKYKERPTQNDHYQMLAYTSAYNSPLGCFISLTLDNETQPKAVGTAADGTKVFDYSISVRDIRNSVSTFISWIKGELGLQ